METDESLTNFQSRVVWVDADQNAHTEFNDLSEPVSDYDAQGAKLESKFASLCEFAGQDGAAQLQVVTALEAAGKVSIG